MVEFYKTHLYLFSQIFSLIVYLVGLAVLFKYRKSIFIASFLAIPQAFYSLMLVPFYWNPNRILFFGIGIEDFLFSFIAGGLIWVGVLLVFKRKITFHYNIKQIILRYLICLGFGLVPFILLYILGFRDILNPFVIMILCCVILLIYNHNLWPILLFESFSTFFVYLLGLKIAIMIWPQLLQTWSWENMWGIIFWGIPMEELVWAFLYGGSWSLLIAFILGVELNKERSFLKIDNMIVLQMKRWLKLGFFDVMK